MTDQEIATKAIDLYESLQALFHNVPDLCNGEAVKAYNTSIRRFEEIYRTLMHQRFELERILLSPCGENYHGE